MSPLAFTLVNYRPRLQDATLTAWGLQFPFQNKSPWHINFITESNSQQIILQPNEITHSSYPQVAEHQEKHMESVKTRQKNRIAQVVWAQP